MTNSLESKIWNTLSAINVNEKVKEKNGLKFLSWAWAWGVLMTNFPQSAYVINEPKIASDGSMMVGVTLTIKEGDSEVSRYMWLPVMDFKNRAIINPNSVDINKAIMRCLTKAISMFGLGFYIYAGEDLPEEEKQALKVDTEQQNQALKVDTEQQNQKRETLIKAVEESAKKGTKTMAEFWKSLSTEDSQLIGDNEKRRIYEMAKVVDNGTAN